MQVPVVHEEHRRLQRLAGRWVGEERFAASPMGPASVRRGWMDARVAIGGFFLLTDYRQEWEGRVSFEGHGVHGWDERQRRVAWYWVDAMAMPPAAPATGRWEADAVLVLQQAASAGQARYTWHLLGPDRYIFRIEMGPDGQAWQPFMEGDYRRQG